MTKPTDADPTKARAEALFKRQELLAEAAANWQAAEAAKSAEAEKTTRLRNLRLAKEQSDQIAVAVKRTRREQKRP